MTDLKIFTKELPHNIVAIQTKDVLLYNKNYLGILDVFLEEVQEVTFPKAIMTIEHLGNIFLKKIS